MNDAVTQEQDLGKQTVEEQRDSFADGIAAIVLIVVFVTACVFWVSSQ